MCDIPFEEPRCQQDSLRVLSSTIRSSETVTWLRHQQDIFGICRAQRVVFSPSSSSSHFAFQSLSCRQDIQHVLDFMVPTMAMIDLSLHTRWKKCAVIFYASETLSSVTNQVLSLGHFCIRLSLLISPVSIPDFEWILLLGLGTKPDLSLLLYCLYDLVSLLLLPNLHVR